MMQLAQDVAASEPGRLLGLTVSEWIPLLLFLLAAIVNVIQAVKGAKDGKKLKAAIGAIEETAASHPEAIGTVKRAVRAKATSMGVQTGLFALKEDVAKHTRRLKKE